MPDNNKEDIVQLLIRKVCAPVRASPGFRQTMINQMIQAKAVTTAGTERIFGFGLATWLILAIFIAAAMIIYGILSVPNPSAIIYSAPLPPLG
jgi:hypothetical protein